MKRILAALVFGSSLIVACSGGSSSSSGSSSDGTSSGGSSSSSGGSSSGSSGSTSTSSGSSTTEKYSCSLNGTCYKCPSSEAVSKCSLSTGPGPGCTKTTDDYCQ